MATLKKVKTTYYVHPDHPSRRVHKDTPGAIRRTVVSRKWYIVYKDGGRVKRVPAYTDKAASQAKLADLLRSRERGEAGLVDPFRRHLDRPVADHVGEYHAHVLAHSRDKTHQKEVRRILTTVFARAGVRTLRDLTPDRLNTYLTGMTQAARTKNMHRRIVVMFGNWLEANGRVPANPVGGKRVRTFKVRARDQKRRRRALTADELRRLLAAARDEPLRAAAAGRGGRRRKDGGRAAARPARLRPETVTALERRGRERELLYHLAIYTGLRRKELSHLRVGHLRLADPTPGIDLPGEYTKNGNPARIPLPRRLADGLRGWVASERRGPADPVLGVPDKSNLSKVHRRLLAAAGIPYRDAEGRYADFHSLRKATNVLLRLAGIPLKDRMVFLRHGSAALTDGTYEDESQVDRSGILNVLDAAGV
jgi:integrase